MKSDACQTKLRSVQFSRLIRLAVNSSKLDCPIKRSYLCWNAEFKSILILSWTPLSIRSSSFLQEYRPRGSYLSEPCEIRSIVLSIFNALPLSSHGPSRWFNGRSGVNSWSRLSGSCPFLQDSLSTRWLPQALWLFSYPRTVLLIIPYCSRKSKNTVHWL
jgi:hypothetical protein